MFIVFLVVAPVPNRMVGMWLVFNKYLSNLSVNVGSWGKGTNTIR